MASEKALEEWARVMREDLEAAARGAMLEHLGKSGIIQGVQFDAEQRGLVETLSPASEQLCALIVRRILESIFTADREIGEAWGRVSGAVSAATEEAHDDSADHNQ